MNHHTGEDSDSFMGIEREKHLSYGLVWSSVAVATTLHNIENISPSWHISHRYGSSLEAQPNDILAGIVTTVMSNSFHNGVWVFMG